MLQWFGDLEFIVGGKSGMANRPVAAACHAAAKRKGGAVHYSKLLKLTLACS